MNKWRDPTIRTDLPEQEIRDGYNKTKDRIIGLAGVALFAVIVAVALQGWVQ